MSTRAQTPRSPAKDTAILMGWIIVLLGLAAFSWVFTQPLRNYFLIRSVNQVLEQSGDSRRLQELAGTNGYFGMGSWFSVAELQRSGNTSQIQTRAFVFSFVGEGTFFPCMAIIGPDGKVQEFIPLNSHGERVLKRIPPGFLRIYSNRIERMKI